MDAVQATSAEVAKTLDALSALAIDLSCHCDVPPDTLILSARKTKDACTAINEAVISLKKILRISEAANGHSIRLSAAPRGDGVDQGTEENR